MNLRLLALFAVAAALSLTAPVWAAQLQEVVAGTFPSTTGGAWGDYDGDGYPDLLLAGGDVGTPVPVAHGPLLYHNNQDLTFTDVSSSLGLPYSVIAQNGVAWGDYNNDGLLDVLLAGAARPYLYRRQQAGFADVTADAGFPMATDSSSEVAWCDYDGDNQLDAFCSNIFGPGYLMKNNGNGTFTEMSTAAGLVGAALDDSAVSAAWGDYDDDGDPDLALARLGKAAKLYRNNGDGTFADVSDESGLSLAVDGSSAVWGDYDNDGHLDLHLGGRLFHNGGDGTFTDLSATAHVLSPTTGGGAAWADYDNDGHLDLYITHWGTDPYLYHSNGDGTFTDVVVGSGLQVPFESQGAAAAWGDIDQDGRMDLLQCTFATTTATNRSLLFHNAGPAGSWLRVQALTSGSGDATGADPVRDAVGARVEVNLDNDSAFPTDERRTLTRLIDGGSGYGAQNEQVAHFGLGFGDGVNPVVAVRVRFRDGSVVVHRSVQANQQIVIRDVPAGRVEIFDDVPLDYWAYAAIAAALDAGIVQGYWDNTYRPTAEVDRGSMAVYLSRAIAGGDGAVPEPTVSTPSFSDVSDDHWAYRYIEYVASPEVNVVQGYPGGNYQPDQSVSRGQMAVYIARAMVTPSGDAGVPDPPAGDPTFTDVTPTNEWAWCDKHVEYLAGQEIVQGYADNTYRPANIVTRDQMAAYVARAFELSY